MTKRLCNSPSSLKKAIGCPRQWFIEKVAKIKGPPIKAGPFGTVLHNVAERFMLDQPLYPEGWETFMDNFGKGPLVTVPADDAARIKTIISSAIDEGVLIRRPGVMPEHKLTTGHGTRNMPVFSEVGISFGTSVDVWHDAGIEDHKSSATTRWLLTPEDLKKDVQMLYYCNVWFEDHPEADICELRHNQYIKKPPLKVFDATCQISRQQAHDTFKEMCGETIELQKALWAIKDQIAVEKDYRSIPGSDQKDGKACNAFRGCPWQRYCNGGCSLERLEKEYKQQADAGEAEAKRKQAVEAAQRKATTNNNTTKGETKMATSLEALLEKNGINSPVSAAPAAPVAPVPPVAAPVTPAAPVAPVPPVAATVAAPAAPWSREGCAMCGNGKQPVPGFTAPGKPCLVCAGMAKTQAPENSPENFDITVNDDGSVQVTRKGAVPEAAPAVEVPAEPVAAEHKYEQTPAAPASPAEPEAPAEHEAPAEEVTKHKRRTAKAVEAEYKEIVAGLEAKISEMEAVTAPTGDTPASSTSEETASLKAKIAELEAHLGGTAGSEDVSVKHKGFSYAHNCQAAQLKCKATLVPLTDVVSTAAAAAGLAPEMDVFKRRDMLAVKIMELADDKDLYDGCIITSFGVGQGTGGDLEVAARALTSCGKCKVTFVAV